MELFVLVLVNFVCAIGMYLLFSMRFSRAIHKAGSHPLSDEVRKSVQGTLENLEATIEFINATVESFEEKKRTFYLLVRKSEEIAERLEKALEKARRRKVIAVDEPQPQERGSVGVEPTAANRPSPVRTPKMEATDLADSVDEAVSAAERALAKLGKDNVRISSLPTRAEEIVRSERTPNVSSYFMNQASPIAQGVLSRMGRVVGRFVGFDFKAFEGVLGNSSNAAGIPSEALADSERAALDAVRQFPDFARVVADEVQRELARRHDDPQKPSKEITDRVEISSEGRLLGTNDIPQGRADRIDFVRSLIEEGQAPENISVRTGLTLSEVNLVRSLPVPQARPRRHRLSSELGPN